MKTAKAVRYDELEGKQVKGCGHDGDRMLIAFTDGTVLALSSQDNGDGSTEIDYEQHEISLVGHWADAAEDAGLISHEEWQEVHRERDAERAERLRKELAALEQRGIR